MEQTGKSRIYGDPRTLSGEKDGAYASVKSLKQLGMKEPKQGMRISFTVRVDCRDSAGDFFVKWMVYGS